MNKVLITDISGFYGHYFKNLFYEDYAFYELGVDIKDNDKVRQRLHEVNPDFIIHLGVGNDQYSKYQRDFLGVKTFQGSVNLIDAAKDLGSLKLLCYLNYEYGQQSQSHVARQACETCLTYAHSEYNLPYMVLRTGYVFGNFFNHARFIEGLLPQIRSHPEQIMIPKSNLSKSTLFIDDMCYAMRSLIENYETNKGKTWSIRYQEETDIAVLVELLKERFRYQGNIVWTEENLMPETDTEQHLTITKTEITMLADLLVKRYLEIDEEINGL